MNTITAPRVKLKSPCAEADEDRLLVSRFARGEPGAFDDLVGRYASRVHRLAARLLAWSDAADDVTQDVFLAVLRQQGGFRGDSQLWTYLAAITVNRCRSLRRRHWVHERVLSVIGRSEPPAANPCYETTETGLAVRAAIARLPTSYRDVIVLRYLEELGIEQIATVLGLRRNTVEVRLSRARKLLEQDLAPFNELD